MPLPRGVASVAVGGCACPPLAKAILVLVEARTRVVDWGRPVKGLPVRLASLIFTLPVPLVCVLGIAFNWPADCPPAGCSDPQFAGSSGATLFFAAVLLVYAAGAAAVASNRVRLGVALLVGAAVLATWAII